MNKRNLFISIIVISQFACTSLWFAGNAVMQDLVNAFRLPAGSLSHLTSAVQFGFIVGTLSFALLTISDRYSPSKVFFASAVASALSNLLIAAGTQNFLTLFLLRFLTGFFLAGIYPVGMKIASDHYEKGLGKALGFLVGALVIGTAFPHLLKGFTQHLNWKYVIFFTSGFSFLGGLLILIFVPDGPFRKPSQHLDIGAFFKIFKNGNVRSAAFGYFGHMWELYTLWAFVPFILSTYSKRHPEVLLNIPVLSFIIIAVGGLACALGGYFSIVFGSRKIASAALASSGLCCIAAVFAFGLPPLIFLGFLIFWGMAVVADSPQFSTLVAQNAAEEYKGTALTIVNCIGFTITIVSIETFHLLINSIPFNYVYLVLAIGPLLGLLAMHRPKIKT
ncbi:MAG TPA: MFS transporter [Ignavibacteria bacterium]